MILQNPFNQAGNAIRLAGDLRRAASYKKYAWMKLHELKNLMHMTGSNMMKRYHVAEGGCVDIIVQSVAGMDSIFINACISGEKCETSFTRQYPVTDQDYVNRWNNQDPTSNEDPFWLSINQVLFEATDEQGKKINSGDVNAGSQERRYIWDYKEGAWGGSSGFSLGITAGATSTHIYSNVGDFTTTLHAWDIKEGTGLDEFPTFSGDMRIYWKAQPTPSFPDWEYYETNAAAHAAWEALPWTLIDTVPNTESGTQTCGFVVGAHGGWYQPAPHDITIPDHYRYAGTKIERDLNFSQAEEGKIIIIPNGVAVASTHLLSALGYDYPGRHGAIFNKATGEQIGRSGVSDFGNRQPYGDWSNIAREDIVVEYRDETGYTMLKDPIAYGGTFDDRGHGWSMQPRGSNLIDDGIYYKSYTCRAKKSGGVVTVI